MPRLRLSRFAGLFLSACAGFAQSTATQTTATQTTPTQTTPTQTTPTQTTPTQTTPAQTTPSLTLQDATAMALRNHPQVLAAQNEVSYQGQRVVEERSALFPNINGDLTGSQANHNARIGAGYLTDSRLFNRFGQGITLSQLVTDLGRTPSLIASSRLREQASNETFQATRDDVVLAVYQTYFDALHAQAVVKVAQETLAARQLLEDQVDALARNNLRSQLDVSFAGVAVSEAKLMVIRAQDDVQRAFAELGRALGSDRAIEYTLVDEPMPPGPPAAADDLIQQAMNNRPELASLRHSSQSAYKFADAERDLKRPSVTVNGVAGFLPLINQEGATPIPPEYEGVAVNINVPIFNGRDFSARYQAAKYQALEADQRLRDEQITIARDVRTAWASASTAFQRIDVTAQFLRQAALGVSLAQGRYGLGLASIVELTQAQLNQTQAEIENLNAKYDYESQYASMQYTIGQLR